MDLKKSKKCDILILVGALRNEIQSRQTKISSVGLFLYLR
jgi:hypothetical protein